MRRRRADCSRGDGNRGMERRYGWEEAAFVEGRLFCCIDCGGWHAEERGILR